MFFFLSSCLRRPVSAGLNDLQTVEVGAEDLGYDDRAVAPLIVLEQRHHRAAGGEAGSVEGVEVACLAAVRRPVAEVCAAGLEVRAGGAGGD